MSAGAGLRAPASSESGVSTDQPTLFPSEPGVMAFRLDWYEPVWPPSENDPARVFPDGRSDEYCLTPFPNESVWLTAPRTFAPARLSSAMGPLAERIPSRVEGFSTPNSATSRFAAEGPITVSRSPAITSRIGIVVVALRKTSRG